MSSIVPDWKAPTPKEEQLNRVLLERTSGKTHMLLERLLADEEINLYHSYANVVSVRRLGYNDHGPVHARITTYNALKILKLLHEGGVETSLEKEEVSDFEQSQVAVALGCFLHDTGMGVAREQHEWHSINLIDPIVVRYLEWLYPKDMAARVVVRSLVHEIIVGHMAHTRIHSIEAGTVLVADGTDMTKGRSLIPFTLQLDPEVGDMHRYSANTISRVEIVKGENKPVRISIQMDNATGLFQIEEVLMTKVKASPIMKHLEIEAKIDNQEPRMYLK
ncbi:MAG: phosphohydrolase [Bacteroidetes bacterium]|nr:phosphohydrolase [Bacteroidota bacterium]